MHNIAYYVFNKATDWQIVDTRFAQVYHSSGPGPKAGSRLGHIKGSINLPFTEVMNEDGLLRPNAELA